MNGLFIGKQGQKSKKGKKSNHFGDKNSYSFDKYNNNSSSGGKLNSFEYLNKGNNTFYDQ